jgi:hypothetical protein
MPVGLVSHPDLAILRDDARKGMKSLHTVAVLERRNFPSCGALNEYRSTSPVVAMRQRLASAGVFFIAG